MTSSLPILLRDPKILLLGGGPVATRKARVLAENDINFRVIARQCNDEIFEYSSDVVCRDIQRCDFDGFNIIVDATGSEAVGRMLHALRSRRFVLVNRVDRPDECDFYFSSLLRYGPLKIAVSTDGASPGAGQVVRDKIARMLPAELGEILDGIATRRKQGVIDPENARVQMKRVLARIYLLGCGPGNPDLLTLQAYRCLNQVDVVLYDHLISAEVLALVPRNTRKHYVGKEKGRHSHTQEQINTLILDYAQKGLSVARLKSGDPYVFGRGAEELEYLLRAGMRVTLVPGISCATAGPALAGVPLTAHGYATSFSVVSAHLAGSKFNAEWIPLLLQGNHTLVVLMGLSFADKIKTAALEAGVDPQTPVALISNATRANQAVCISTIEHLDVVGAAMEKPAIMVFGAVVGLYAILG
jgi:uroporphyrin-III C-methyltransferase/precorrin-2 dehydrogenase/sirohydrochlorin ferrochelatase